MIVGFTTPISGPGGPHRPINTPPTRWGHSLATAGDFSMALDSCQVGCSHEVVRAVVRRESKRPVRSESWRPGLGRLTLSDREDQSWPSWRRVLHGDRGPARQGHIHGVAGGGCHRRARRLPRLAGAPAGPSPGAAYQRVQAVLSRAGDPGQSLFVQGRGELRRELARCLRAGRIKRRPRQRPDNTGQLRDMIAGT